MERSWKEKICSECNNAFRTQSITVELCKACRGHKYSEKKCTVCSSMHTKAGKTCGKTCTDLLKKETCQKSCGAPHNFSRDSKSRIKQEAKMHKEEGIVNVFQRPVVKEKIKEKMIEKFGGWFSSTEDGKRSIKESNFRKYGETNIMKTEEGKRRMRESNLEKYGETSWTKTESGKIFLSEQTSSIRNSEEFKQAMYQKGMWKNPAEMHEAELYYFEVSRHTGKSLKEFGEHKFGIEWKTRRSFYDMHVDHIYPIIKGFKNNVPSELIGNIENLDLRTMHENLSKGSKIIEIPTCIKYFFNSKTKC